MKCLTERQSSTPAGVVVWVPTETEKSHSEADQRLLDNDSVIIGFLLLCEHSENCSNNKITWLGHEVEYLVKGRINTDVCSLENALDCAFNARSSTQ